VPRVDHADQLMRPAGIYVEFTDFTEKHSKKANGFRAQKEERICSASYPFPFL
jgi:hypothetical protein